jgi:hypothetical protein
MIGICIEAGISCPSCESYVPLNALVPSVLCSGCGKDLELGIDVWKTVLEDSLEQASFLEDGEGSSSTIFGSYNYKVLYGRLAPRYDDTKDDIDIDMLLEKLDEGHVLHPESGAPTRIRRLPEQYRDAFRGVVALIGEDPSQLPGASEGQPMKTGLSGPIAFQCPNCGGSLIVDGTSRMADCRFCETQVYLPDDLWRRLHPVKKEKRWFLLFDEFQKPFTWGDDVWDAVYDTDGNLYILIEHEYGDSPLLVSTKPDRMLRWRRGDLDIKPSTSGGEPRIALAGDNRLLVTCGSGLFILSSLDGSSLGVLDAPEGNGTPPEQRFSMKGCFDFGVFPGDTLFLYRDCDRSNESGYFYKFQRFDLEGNFKKLWDRTEEKLGFRDRVRKWWSGSRRKAAYFTDTSSYPVRTRDSDIRLAIGQDGSVYMLSYNNLLRLDHTGKKVYLVELPCSYTSGRPVVNASGEVFVLVHGENDKTEVLSVSPDGTSVSVAVASTLDGGPVEDVEILTLSPDGRFSLLGYNGKWIDAERQLRLPGECTSTQEAKQP